MLHPEELQRPAHGVGESDDHEERREEPAAGAGDSASRRWRRKTSSLMEEGVLSDKHLRLSAHTHSGQMVPPSAKYER